MPIMADIDPSATLAARLAYYKERGERERAAAHDVVTRHSGENILTLVAALEAVLALHVQAVIEDMPDPFHYCKTCSGHPAWPCPEVRAITSALTGEERSDG
jgi:hypothetical protein